MREDSAENLEGCGGGFFWGLGSDRNIVGSVEKRKALLLIG